MPTPKSDKVVPLHDSGEKPSPPPFVFGAAYAQPSAFEFPDKRVGAKPGVEEAVIHGVDLSEKPKVVFLAGRGKTGKTTAIRWMSERALVAGRPLLMGDVDPGNISFGTYFQGVHEPPDRDSPAVAFKWLEEFVGHAILHRQTAVIDLGGGDTTLRRLADELPDLAKVAEDRGCALVVLYFVGTQIEDLAPISAMYRRTFRPHGTAIVMNEAAVDLGFTREQAFGPLCRHPLVIEAVSAGAVPVWMPRLHNVAGAIELQRLHFLAAAAHAVDESGMPRIGITDAARVRVWLAAMERQFAGIATWLP